MAKLSVLGIILCSALAMGSGERESGKESASEAERESGKESASEAERGSEGYRKLQDSYSEFFTTRYSLEQGFPFRLVSIRDELVEFTPRMDIRLPILKLQPRELIDSVRGALMNSFMPVMYGLLSEGRESGKERERGTERGSGKESASTASTASILTIVHQFANRATQKLAGSWRDDLASLISAQKQNVTYRLFLTPFRKTDADLFYGAQKINMVREGKVNLLQNRDVQEYISKEIDLYRAFLYYHHDGKKIAPEILAAQLHFTINKQNEAVLTADVLLHLYPQTKPYDKSTDGVKLTKLVVPQGDKFRFPTALLTIKTVLNSGQDPTMKIKFGNFSHLKDFQFTFVDRENAKFTPFLAGHLQKTERITVKFQFREIDVSLTKARAELVQMVFTPGLKLGSVLTADLGGYRMKKIDDKFKTAIDEEIATEIAEIRDKVIKKTLENEQVANFMQLNIIAGLHELFKIKQ